MGEQFSILSQDCPDRDHSGLGAHLMRGLPRSLKNDFEGSGSLFRWGA
jgi:hypothetical protein